MTARPELTAELKRLVLAVEDDLRARLEQETSVKAAWQDEHRRALSAQRTGSVWETFRDDKLTQVAVSWVLTTVFVRFCEDNNLVAKVWISGPGAKRQHALDAELAFFAQYPEQTAREWLLQAVRHLRELPATAGLVDDHTPLWQLKPSGDWPGGSWLSGGRRMRMRMRTPLRDLSDPELSTRFLGDLYQDLSEHAKKTYALLQTPVFVEESILDQTLEPALAERPFGGVPADRPDLWVGALPARGVRAISGAVGGRGGGAVGGRTGTPCPRHRARRGQEPVRRSHRAVSANRGGDEGAGPDVA